MLFHNMSSSETTGNSSVALTPCFTDYSRTSMTVVGDHVMTAGLLSFRADFSEPLVRRGKLLPKSAIFNLGSLRSCVQDVVEPAARFVPRVDGRARTNYAERSVHCSF